MCEHRLHLTHKTLGLNEYYKYLNLNRLNFIKQIFLKRIYSIGSIYSNRTVFDTLTEQSVLEYALI